MSEYIFKVILFKNKLFWFYGKRRFKYTLVLHTLDIHNDLQVYLEQLINTTIFKVEQNTLPHEEILSISGTK